MSALAHEGTTDYLPTEQDIRGSLHEALRLPQDQEVTAYDPLIREDYDTSMVRLKTGALVIECTVGGDDNRHKLVEVDDHNRPLPEEIIAVLGREALKNRMRGKYVYRTVCRK